MSLCRVRIAHRLPKSAAFFYNPQISGIKFFTLAVRITPKIQSVAFDVANWEADAEFGVFPQGARAKDAIIAPDAPPEAVIIPGRRYLFKHSRRNFPDQFWCEIVAYRIGCLLGVKVPPAFAAWNSSTGISAALIEWFYVDGHEAFVWGGDFLQAMRPGYDRDQGSQHNLQDITALMRSMIFRKILKPADWRQWWVDALLFDALIGNTDRHQDNWGFVIQANGQGFKLSPLFDNGTSLGHERLTSKVEAWTDEKVDWYIGKGCHRLKWSLEEWPPTDGHLNLLRKVLSEWPQTCQTARQRLDFTEHELAQALDDLTGLEVPVRLSPERRSFMLRLLRRRLELLKELLHECPPTHY